MTDTDPRLALWLDSLRSESEAFARSCASVGLDTPVPSCPGWDVADLVWHLTWVHDLLRVWTERLSPVPERIERAERPDRDSLIDVFRAGAEAVHVTVAAADPDARVWTFTNEHTVRFIIRRLAHETAVHRWDANLAAGAVTSVPGPLASDGIDEFLTHFVGVPADEAVAVGGSVHLHCTDVAGEWMVRPHDDGQGFELERTHAKGDCALRGGASDLLLALWHRRPMTDLDVVGDIDVARRFLAFPRVR
jgi:uncharacterized protein (TIGR03083 family)